MLVTTLTKRMAEDLTQFYQELGVRVRYLHSDVETLERIEILRELRRGAFDVLVGINLLREGLDLPEVSLVAILDADKEGFLRSAGSLIQTAGRAARNVNGLVIMYADVTTDSMRAALGEMEAPARAAGGVQPRARDHPGVDREGDGRRPVQASTSAITPRSPRCGETHETFRTRGELEARVAKLEGEMRAAAANLEFERARGVARPRPRPAPARSRTCPVISPARYEKIRTGRAAGGRPAEGRG